MSLKQRKKTLKIFLAIKEERERKHCSNSVVEVAKKYLAVCLSGFLQVPWPATAAVLDVETGMMP